MNKDIIPYNETSERNWLICLALAICLGIFGGHKFYVDRIRDGVIMLVLTIIVIGIPVSIIICAVDLIQLLKGSFMDSKGKILKKI